MRILGSLPIIYMVCLALFAIWDLKINGFVPPVPPDQLGQNNAEITAIMAPHRDALKTDMSANVVPAIDESLSAVATEYGEISPEYNQALIEAALMLNENSRADLAQGYMSDAVDVSREVYGTEHRETALSLNDLANLSTDGANQEYSEEAIGYLREALEIRKNVLEPDHQEVLVNQVNLADQLFLEWQAKDGEKDKSSLEESSQLLREVLAVYESKDEADVNQLDNAAVGLLFARVSFYRDDFETAAEYYGKRLAPVAPETDPAAYMIFTNSYAEYIVSLKKTGREDEAKEIQQGIVKYLTEPQSPEADTTAEAASEVVADQDAPAAAESTSETDADAVDPAASDAPANNDDAGDQDEE